MIKKKLNISNDKKHFQDLLSNTDTQKPVYRISYKAQQILRIREESKKKLLESAFYGRKQELEELTKKGVDLKSQNELGENALHLSVLKGNYDIVQYLLQQKNHKDFINQSENNLNTPLHYAILLSPHDSMLKTIPTLIKHGSNIDSINKAGFTPRTLIVYSGLLNKFDQTSREMILKDYSIENYFHIAAFYNDQDYISQVLGKGKKYINITTNENFRFLPEIIPNTDDLRFIEIADSKGWTALHFAAYNGDFDLVKLLVKYGAKVNILDEQGYSPMYLAIEKGHINIYNFLVENKGSIRTTAEENHLEYAIKFKQFDAANMLTERGFKTGKCFINKPMDLEANTLLMKNILQGNFKNSLQLIKMGAGIANKNKKGDTALSIAYEKQDIALLQLLLWNMPEEFFTKYQDKYGKSVFHYMTAAGLTRMLKDYLPNYSYKVNLLDEAKASLMHEAAKFGYTDIIKMLKENGFDLDAQDRKGLTPTDYALEYSDPDTVEFLLIVCRSRPEMGKFNTTTTPQDLLLVTSLYKQFKELKLLRNEVHNDIEIALKDETKINKQALEKAELHASIAVEKINSLMKMVARESLKTSKSEITVKNEVDYAMFKETAIPDNEEKELDFSALTAIADFKNITSNVYNMDNDTERHNDNETPRNNNDLTTFGDKVVTILGDEGLKSPGDYNSE
ncbi:MAG: uncharacterized protein K0Q51_888 [Rickettsiaceae bacterium]|jgi:ankyrin repeat protein|nr:uncharacterized protein [Rickettsiaceae bacterium]